MKHIKYYIKTNFCLTKAKTVIKSIFIIHLVYFYLFNNFKLLNLK